MYFMPLRCIAVIALIVSCSDVRNAAADENPSALRLGYIVPAASSKLDQPMFVRYANDFAGRLGAHAGIAIVTLTGDTAASRDLCIDQRLMGYVRPRRHWHIGDDAVAVTAGVSLLDCDGNIYYSGSAKASEQRFAGALPQQQVDRVTEVAEKQVLAAFDEYQRTHRALWTQMRATGTFEPSSSPTPST